MSPIVPFSAFACIAVCLIAPLGAQDLGLSLVRDEPTSPGFTEPSRWMASTESLRAKGLLDSPAPVIGVQDMRTLEFQAAGPRRSGPRAALDALRIPTIQRRFVREELSGTGGKQLHDELELVSASYREPAKPENPDQCTQIALAVNRRIILDPTTLLETVADEVAANPHCCCEIVKSSIQACDADVSQVVEIVDTAIRSSPENMRLISQCAIAVVPDSLSAVQALLALLDPQGGNQGRSAKASAKSAKSAKSGKDFIGEIDPIQERKTDMNPLDLPPVLVAIPPPILPPPVTRVDP